MWALVFSFIFVLGGQTEKGAPMKEQIVRLLLQMDQRSAVCWTHKCVCSFYTVPDCQTPYVETAGVSGWLQEMTVIIPNVPSASVSLSVMDKVCNGVETQPPLSAAF